MEMQRRIGRGTIAAALGPKAVATDRFLRTLGVYRAAESAYASLKPEVKAMLDAYVGGINAFLEGKSGSAFPPEFTFTGVEPEPWRGADVLVWAKMMAWDLGGNYTSELLRSDLIAKVGPERAAQLTPDYPGGAALILPANPGGSAPTSELLALADHVQAQTGMGAGIVGGTGSNDWVISGAKSTTGKPLLADDPHLGFRTPAIWYMAEIQGGALHAVGASIPGLPGIVIGHNERIAWGVTNVGPDVQDLYRERLDPAGASAEFQGQFEPLTIISDTIKVKDGADVPLAIRISRHGPLISDALNANNSEDPDAPEREALAFRWTALDPRDDTLEAFLGVNFAQNWEEFKEAFRPYGAPSQNFVYADIDGNIGYFAPGNIPIRAGAAPGTEGLLPAEGWTGAAEWSGYIPFEELPQAYNPPQGFIATANNKVVGPDYPYFISHEWAPPFRAERITALLTAKDKLSLDDMAAIQADRHSLYAEQMLPLLLAQVQPTTDQQKQAVELLRDWDYVAAPDSAATAIFQAWTYYLAAPILSDELGERLMETYGGRRSFLDQSLPAILANPNDPWCDNVGTAGATEDCPAQVSEALEVALRDLGVRMGKTPMAEWRWDYIHIAEFAHNPLDAVPALRGFFSQAIGNGGDGSTVNVAAVSASAPFDQVHGPIYRHIIDLGDLSASRMINAPGQSGHLLSDHYDDLLAKWQRVEYIPMRWGRAAAEGAQAGTLTLTP
ncbi:MAG TPA: penicillin acylase family protein, partial [Herpetosiphonaceae bacterium]|nr:penicillin acylase family protein [Herpetosiphonaceae bacterium]